MLDLKAYAEETERNAIIVQRALRDIDAELMATALVGMPEDEARVVFRNMSTRAVAFIKNDIRDLAGAAPAAIEAARDFFAGLLARHAAEYVEGGNPGSGAEPPLPDLSSEEGIAAGFSLLAEFARGRGILALEPLMAKLGDPLARTGLLMLIEGWDPLLMRSVLERAKEARIRSLSLRMDMIIEGLDSLAARDSSLVTDQKLRAFIAKP